MTYCNGSEKWSAEEGRSRMTLAFGVVFLALLVWPQTATAAEIPTATQEALRTSDSIHMATRRKDGSLSSVKPVWFYYEQGDELFFTTSPDSWKAKRIARGSPVYIWVGAKNGPFVLGEARQVSDSELVDRMGDAYGDKYWIAWLGFFKPRGSRVESGKTNAYLVTLRPGDPPALQD